MMEREIHTLIIWSEARTKKQEIEKQLIRKFQILKEFVCNWKATSFEKNLMSFYAHSQKDKSYKEFKVIVQNKIKHCGLDEFYLYIVEDLNPVYSYRQTSNGNRKINTNIFDLKLQLRAITGGGHKIHASDTTFESNKDLTILFGKNTEDFLNSEDFSVRKGFLENDCIGTNGFKSVEQLFYLLNNSIDYVVLRNFECLLEVDGIKKVNDIDCLVEDLNYVRYLTHAKPLCPENAERINFTIPINQSKIRFDLNFLGDNYFDINWQNNIIKEYDLYKTLIRTPNIKNHFYALLYHNYVQKVKVKEDDFTVLEELGREIAVAYHREMSTSQVKEILDDFFKAHHYRYTIPNDSSVVFNYSFLKEGQLSIDYGERLTSSLIRHNQELFYAEVFLNKAEKKICKVCSSHIGDNEKKYLDKLQAFNIVPQLYGYKKEGDNAVVEMEYMEGIVLNKLYEYNKFWRKKNIFFMLKECFVLLIVLKEQNIQHRDIKPDNLILVKTDQGYQLKIIDFGWARDLDEDNAITPSMLGGTFKYKEDEFSDIYSMKKTLESVYGGLPSIKKSFDRIFFNVSANPSISQLKDIYNNIPTHFKLTLKESIKWEFKKYPRLYLKLHQLYYKFK